MNLAEHPAPTTPVHAFYREARHALGSPLGAIMATAELVEMYAQHGKPDEVRRLASRITDECERHARMIQDIFRALQDMEVAMLPTPTATLGVALARAGENFVAQGGNLRPVGVDVRPWISGAALELLLGRLIDNAAASGAGTFIVNARDEGREVVLEITDDGPGLELVTAEQVVRPFVSGSPTTHTGVGLWWVKTLVEQAGGRIDIDGDRGRFALTISLPAAPPVAVAAVI
jgi:two-component system, OmpR family, sensor histidine kinase KdpD